MLTTNWRLFGAVVAVNFLSFAAGGAFTWTSPVLPKLKGEVEPRNIPFESPITPFQESWIASLVSLGAAIGPFIGNVLVDRIGRKKTLLIMGLPMLAAYMILAFANKIELYYTARFLLGLGAGCVFSIVPMYVGEIAEDSNRGSLGCIMISACTIGSLFCLGVGPYVSITQLCLCCTLPIILFLIMFGYSGPESSYFYMLHQKKEQARDVLHSIRYSRDAVGKELENIAEEIDKSKLDDVRVRNLLKSRGLVKALTTGLGLMFFQQFTGISVVVSYMQSIFEASGSKFAPDISAIVVGCVQVVINLITVHLVDKIGRKILLIVSLLGVVLSTGSLSAYFCLKDYNYDVGQLSWLPIASLILYTVVYNIGMGSVPWTMMGELFPPQFKAIATTVTTSLCLFLSFLLTVFYPNLVLHLGIGKSFMVFPLCSVLGILFVVLWVPETKGKSLQQIQILLEQKRKS